MTEELKSCPFCGGKVETFNDRYGYYQILFFKCKKCGAIVSFDNTKTYINNYMSAVRAWNRRVKDD